MVRCFFLQASALQDLQTLIEIKTFSTRKGSQDSSEGKTLCIYLGFPERTQGF